MTIELSESIIPARGQVSDIPEEYLTDIQAFRELENAKSFVDQVMVAGLTDAQLKPIYEAVAAYYMYVNWTGLAEQKMGTIPSTSFFRVAVLREKAMQQMGENLIVPLNDNLTINYKRFGKMTATATALTPSIIDDDS